MTETSQGTARPTQSTPEPIDPGVRVGHVHLRTADIDRVRAFIAMGFGDLDRDDLLAELEPGA
jgi:catechol-2,3-dioxygenase